MKKKTTPSNRAGLHNARFESVLQVDVPRSRNGKHHGIVGAILADVEALAVGSALKIPLSELSDSKENVRSALSRETRKRRTPIHTAADEKYLYVWRDEA